MAARTILPVIRLNESVPLSAVHAALSDTATDIRTRGHHPARVSVPLEGGRFGLALPRTCDAVLEPYVCFSLTQLRSLARRIEVLSNARLWESGSPRATRGAVEPSSKVKDSSEPLDQRTNDATTASVSRRTPRQAQPKRPKLGAQFSIGTPEDQTRQRTTRLGKRP